MRHSGGMKTLKANSFDLISLYLSAAAHDVDHPGHNNLFESKTKSRLATLYNDIAVLENHHTATFFFILEDEQCNLFQNLSRDDYSKMRKLIVDNILYTDMSKHFPFMGELKALPNKDDYDPSGKYKPDIMKALVHGADIGNPSRPFEVCKIWTFRILSEFFA
jgi:3'5'-cyclic nucleotide phosphodiesterase